MTENVVTSDLETISSTQEGLRIDETVKVTPERHMDGWEGTEGVNELYK